MNKVLISHPTRQITGQINLSGSKSISNRVLIIQALCESKFEIENLSSSQDTETMRRLLASKDLEQNAGHAGTTYRFLTAYYALTGREVYLSGSERMHQRPIAPLVDALRSLGADIRYGDQEGYPPLQIKKANIKGDKVKLAADVSSQFISALLLVAPSLPNGLQIELESEPISRPYIEMTLSIMTYFGIEYNWSELTINIEPQKYKAKDYYVESDWSSASYLYAIAAIAESANLEISGLTNQKLQGDSAIVNIMKSFGVHTQFKEKAIIIHKEQVMTPFFEYDFISQPDIAQTISVVAAAKGTSLLMSGLQTLKIKETDRIAALKAELSKFSTSLMKMPTKFAAKTGIEYYMQEGKATTDIVPSIHTYDDHRMAMAFTPLALLYPIEIQNPEVVKKSYPSFWEDMIKLGFEVK